MRNLAKRLSDLEQRARALSPNAPPAYISAGSEEEAVSILSQHPGWRCKVYLGGVSPDDWPGNGSPAPRGEVRRNGS
ncbi:MAG: hypothetical protein IT330_12340 [Anaerolineae bacterium]|nr:hypothetical protein [Anaerolineae bacterium]